MSKYFNQSRRQTVDRSTEGRAIEQAEFQRELEEVSKTSVSTGGTPISFLSGCRKVRLPESSRVPLILSRAEIDGSALESYRALRTRLLRAQATQALRSVVLSSAVAGEGKTLTSMNLALCFSRLRDFPVLVVDSDLRTHGLTRLLGDPAGPGLSDILAGSAEYEDAILATDYPNLYVLGAGSCCDQAAELYSGNQWKEFVGWCGQTFRITLVDSPPILPVADFEQIINTCDGSLIVVRAHRTPREMLERTARRIDPKKLLGVVFNGASSTELNEYAKGYAAGYAGPVVESGDIDEKTANRVDPGETV